MPHAPTPRGGVESSVLARVSRMLRLEVLEASPNQTGILNDE